MGSLLLLFVFKAGVGGGAGVLIPLFVDVGFAVEFVVGARCCCCLCLLVLVVVVY